MNKHPHFDLYCREHDVRIGGCRCPGPDKLKQTTDCPGDSCPGNKKPSPPEDDQGNKQKIFMVSEYGESLVSFAARKAVYDLADALDADDSLGAEWTSLPELNALFVFIGGLESQIEYAHEVHQEALKDVESL